MDGFIRHRVAGKSSVAVDNYVEKLCMHSCEVERHPGPALCQKFEFQRRPRLLVKSPVGVEKLGSETRFPSGEFLPVRVFLAVVCFLRGCHRWLRSHVEEAHQSLQVPCHGS